MKQDTKFLTQKAQIFGEELKKYTQVKNGLKSTELTFSQLLAISKDSDSKAKKLIAATSKNVRQ